MVLKKNLYQQEILIEKFSSCCLHWELAAPFPTTVAQWWFCPPGELVILCCSPSSMAVDEKEESVKIYNIMILYGI
jgi:alpha-mannosidase